MLKNSPNDVMKFAVRSRMFLEFRESVGSSADPGRRRRCRTSHPDGGGGGWSHGSQQARKRSAEGVETSVVANEADCRCYR